jgi:hypothetical protein
MSVKIRQRFHATDGIGVGDKRASVAEIEEHLGFRHPRIVVDVGMATEAQGRRRRRTRRQNVAGRRLGFRCMRRCGGLGG